MARKKKKVRYQVRKKETKVEIERKERTSTQDKYYWTRVGVAVIAAIIGVFLFQLVGWWMLLYIAGFMLAWPFFQSFIIFRLPYKKGKWDWKKILTKGIGGFFFTFMLVSTACFTLINYQNYNDRLQNPADTNDIIVSNNIGYVADGSNGLLILNCSSPNHRSLIGQYKSSDFNAQTLTIENNMAFIADDLGNMRIIDISDLSNPIILGEFSLNDSDPIKEIIVNGTTAYLAAQSKGFISVDIHDPSNPSQLDLYNGNIDGIRIENSIAYLADASLGLRMVNISNPSNLQEISTVTLTNGSIAIDIQDSLAILTSTNNLVHFINISDNANLTQIAQYNTTATNMDVEIDGNIAYVSGGKDGIYMIDFSDSKNPVNSTSVPYNTIGSAYHIYINNNYAWIADGKNGLSIIYLPDPAPSPEEVVASSMKTISFGWTWIPLSLLSSGIIASMIIKKKKFQKIM
ncbi:MAG: LVIVD repeat-containing protein [Promethearchaeota archaeon]